MKYLGIVKRENCLLTMPDGFEQVAKGLEYEAVQIEDAIFLLPAPLDTRRLKRIADLADQSINEHRGALEGLAR